ncbi:MAG: hypothetical protein NTX90_07230, partial [Alphaproteobacteria bacterium]|nr:hypothetical protein [Alphaproteobacteria bacterium]
SSEHFWRLEIPAAASRNIEGYLAQDSADQPYFEEDVPLALDFEGENVVESVPELQPSTNSLGLAAPNMAIDLA